MIAANDIISELKSLSNPKNIEGMARFGISRKGTLGIPIPTLRTMAKKIGKNHQLALELWDSGIHEARLLAGFIGDPEKLTESQIESWVKDFDSWDICDQVCSALFDKSEFAWKKVFEWPEREEEFVRRAGFALIAALSVHDKLAKDEQFVKCFPLIIRYSYDDRNFVRKAVNWALRQIGKRNMALNAKALAVAKQIQKLDSKSARWIANDAIRELENEKVKKRVKEKSK